MSSRSLLQGASGSSDKSVASVVEWNKKHNKDFRPVPEEILKAALDTIEPDGEHEELFCPKCGCMDTDISDNMASYPEQWIRVTCAHCGFLTAEVDNSPAQHCFDYKDNDYVIEI